MIRRGTVTLAGALALPCFAQFPALPVDSLVDLPGRWSNSISLRTSADYNTNNLRNELPWALYQGGFVARDIRERTQEGLKGGNSAGYDITVRLTWTGADSLFGKPGWRPTVSAAHRDALGVRFTDDLYSVTFFGNAAYEGSTAELGPSAHALTRYQTLGLGVQDARSRSYLRLDAIKGQAHSATDLRIADVLTGTDGRVIEADLHADYWQSDTAGSAFDKANGMGMALSGCWAGRRSVGGTSMELALTVEDLGFVNWNANSVRIRKDTLIQYEGLRVADIFDLDEVLLGGDQLLDTFGLRYEREAYTTLLPFRVGMSLNAAFTGGWYAGLELEQRNLPGFVPQATVSGTRRFGKHALIGASVSYGGFGGLRAGLGTRVRVGQSVLITASVPHLPGFLLGEMKGLGALFGMAVGF